jgi:hypothetical protein
VQGRNSTRPFLRLVDAASCRAPTPLVDNALVEAEKSEAKFGRNTYSCFIREHGGLPDRQQAVTIGKLMGVRVKASDGSLQPPLTEAERARHRQIRAEHKRWSRESDHIWRIKTAIAAISQNFDHPSAVIEYGANDLLTPAIRAQLEIALPWMIRFIRELRRRDKASRTEI